MASGVDAEYVLLNTNMGKVVVELYTDHAPRACTNFATLASKGYYDQVVVRYKEATQPGPVEEARRYTERNLLMIRTPF
ncbi:heme binding [Orbilia oligospora]|uniref:Peptidyl-prolyl cis-trans isomerase-like 1 n=1 Tax=Orbilia oligospora TaxID=2813651 RepID=A0A6G1M8M2_ORBOL|nr:heme binding [Orbilia oligospora]KAF3249561.1 heme binding [Orbilia oligospora]